MSERIPDDRRERAMITLLRLLPGATRGGTDATDELGHLYELKSTTVNSVSTGRDVGPHTIESYRKHYWVFAKGTQRGNDFAVQEMYFLDPGRMEEWFQSIEARFAPDTSLRDRVLQAVRTILDAVQIRRLTYLINRGMTLNNPKIPWSYIQSRGLRLDLQADPATQLRQLVRQHPMSIRPEQ